MQQPEPYMIHRSAPPSGHGLDLRSDLNRVFEALVAAIDNAHQRIDALESDATSQQNITSFCERRPSWTVRQLADDLNVHPNTVLNWLALPADHPRHLDSFQPGGTGPHMILPEHVADWMSRSGRAA